MIILLHWIPAFAGMTYPCKPSAGWSCRQSLSRAWTGSRLVPLSRSFSGSA